jgi:hypothetical protein
VLGRYGPWVGGWLCAVFVVCGVQWAFVGGGTAPCSPSAGSRDAPSSPFVGAPCLRLPFVGTGEVGVVLRVRDWWGVVLGRYGPWVGGWLCAMFAVCGVQWAFVGGGTALCSPFAGSTALCSPFAGSRDALSSPFMGAPCSRLPFVGTGEVGVVLCVRDWWGVVLGRYGCWWGGGRVPCSRFVGCGGPSSL